jgi:hypothetical protein
MLTRRSTPKTSVRPTATKKSQAAKEAASTTIALNVLTRVARLTLRQGNWRAACHVSIGTFGSLEAGLDPVNGADTVWWIDALSCINLDVGDDRFVPGFVPA